MAKYLRQGDEKYKYGIAIFGNKFMETTVDLLTRRAKTLSNIALFQPLYNTNLSLVWKSKSV